jgi:hypothetical protein
LIRKSVVLALLMAMVPLYAGAEPGDVPVDVDGTAYSVPYDAQNVEVLQVSPDPDIALLSFDVLVADPSGILEVTLVRALFDAVSDDGDEEFFAIADGGRIVDVVEVATTEQSRTIRLALEGGTLSVDVIGTRLGADTPGPISDSSPADKPTPDEPPADKPAPDEPPADTPTPDEPPADKPAPMPAPGGQDPDAGAPDVPEQDPSAGASAGLLVGISAAATIAAVVIILLYLIRVLDRRARRRSQSAES